MVEICKIFTFSQDSVFTLSLKAEQGFPEALTRAPPSSFSPCFTNLFRKICSWTRWGSPIRPVGPKFKASPASEPNEGSSPTTTQARRPILLEEMIHKVEKQGFRSNAEIHDQIGSSHRKGDPGYPWGALDVPPARTASPRVCSRRVPAHKWVL